VCAGALLVTSFGCGNDGEESRGEIVLKPFPYVVTRCGETDAGWTAHQELRIRQPDGTNVVVKEFDFGVVPELAALCPIYGQGRAGAGAMAAGFIQRVGINPQASTIVFEVTDDFSILPNRPLAPEDEGIFAVRPDGSELRRITSASRDPTFRFVIDPSLPLGVNFNTNWPFTFSPGGNKFAFTDRGPGPAGEEAIQVFVFDLKTNAKRQVTKLPVILPDRFIREVHEVHFVSDDLVAFVTEDAAAPARRNIVSTDGRGEAFAVLPPPSFGGGLSPFFRISGSRREIGVLQLDGTPVNGTGNVFELFSVDFRIDPSTSAPQISDLLQLTDFKRGDTGGAFAGAPITSDGRRVLFVASADPFGRNPHENCQVFSIGVLGDRLRQLTDFDTSNRSAGCGGAIDPADCSFFFNGQDVEADAVVLNSTCIPGGGVLNGDQLFEMRSDGSGLRQITDTLGAHLDGPGPKIVELPGQMYYPEVFR